MSDARTDSRVLFRKGPLKVIAIITLWSFLFTTIGNDIALGKAWAATTPLEPSSVGSNRPGSSGYFKDLNPDTFNLPQYLGQIKDRYNANSDKIVIHIQDAHCNYYAQNKIAEIIEYLNKEHGINTIDLEGGTRSYDLSIFTGIDDRSVRQKVSDYFLKEGMINGAEYFAVNNPEKVTLWGTEDTKLYLENLDIYRDSLKNKDEIDKALNSISLTLDNLKVHIYSADLLELDQKYSQYKINSLDFKAYLGYLLHKAKSLMIDVRSFSNIYLLSQTIEQEGLIDFRKANAERDMLVDKLQKRLSKKALEELVQKTVEFTREKISQKDFYQYLLGKAKSAQLDLKDFPTLQNYIVYISIYEAADKSRLMDEMEEMENKIKEALYQNERQRDLDRLSKNLVITTNIFNILLTKKDYEYYKLSEASFNADNYVSFINKEAPPYKISATLDDSVKRLDQYRRSMARFYEYSFKRDKVFLKNMKLDKGSTNDKAGTGKTAIFISGGFHTENLCELFRANNISYVSIIPYFKNSEGYQCPYYNLLVGNNNKLVDNLLADNFSLAVFTHLCDAANDVYIADRQRAWEISVRVAESFFRGEASCTVIDGGRRMCFSFDPQGGQSISGFTIDNKQVFVRVASREEIVRAAKRSLTGWQKLKRRGIILFLALLALNANVFQPSNRPIPAQSKPPAALVKFDTAAYVGSKSDRTSITETEYRVLRGKIPQLRNVSYEDFRRDQPSDQQKETIQRAINLAMATDGRRAASILDVIKHIVILDVDYPAMAVEGGFVIMGKNHLKNITNENILRGWALVLMHEGKHIKDALEGKGVLNQRDLASQAKGEESSYEEMLYWTERLGYDQQTVDAQRFVYEHIKDAGYKGLMASFVTTRTRLEGNAFFTILTADKILRDMHKGQLPKGAQIEYLGYYNATHQGRKCFNLEYKIGEKIYRVFVDPVEEEPGMIKMNFLEQPKEIDKKESVYYSLDVQSSTRSGEENGAAIRRSETNLNAVEHFALNQAIAELIDPQAHRVGAYEGLTLYAIPNLMARFREILMTMANPNTGALYTEEEARAAADIIAHAGHRRGNIYMDANIYNGIRVDPLAIRNIARHERGHLDEYRRRAAAEGYTNLDDIPDNITARFYAREDELAPDIESERAKQDVITFLGRQARIQVPGIGAETAVAPEMTAGTQGRAAYDAVRPPTSGDAEYPTGLSPPNKMNRARNLNIIQRRDGFVARRMLEGADINEDARDTAIGILANIRNTATYGAIRNLLMLAANAVFRVLLTIIRFFADRPGIERILARLTLGGVDVRTQIQTFIGVARELFHAFTLERNGFHVEEFNVTEEGEIDLVLRQRASGEIYIAEVQGGAGVAEKGRLMNWLVGEVKQHKSVLGKLGTAGTVSVAGMANTPVPISAPCIFSCSEAAFKGATTSKDDAEVMLRDRLTEVMEQEGTPAAIATEIANTIHLMVVNEDALTICQDGIPQEAQAIGQQYTDIERMRRGAENEFNRNVGANFRALMTRLRGFNVRIPQLLLRGLFDRYGFDNAGTAAILAFFERIGRDQLPGTMAALEATLNLTRHGDDRYDQVLAFIARVDGMNVGQDPSAQAGTTNITPAGNIARGDAVQLHEALSAQVLRPVRGSLNLNQIAQSLKDRIDTSDLPQDKKDEINRRIDDSINRIQEFNAIVLHDQADRNTIIGWLLGFNTAGRTQTAQQDGPENAFQNLFKAKHPEDTGTLYLATEVLDLIQDNKLLLEEYILHEIICPYLGHVDARKLQEKIFEQNYVNAPGEEGFKDGELRTTLRQVIQDAITPAAPAAVSMNAELQTGREGTKPFYKRSGFRLGVAASLALGIGATIWLTNINKTAVTDSALPNVSAPMPGQPVQSPQFWNLLTNEKELGKALSGGKVEDVASARKFMEGDIEVLRPALKSSNIDLVRAALTVISDRRIAVPLGDIEQFLQPDRDPICINKALNIVWQQKLPITIDHIKPLLTHKDTEIIRSALYDITECKIPVTFEFLMPLFSHEDVLVSDAAVLVMLKQRIPVTMDSLKPLLESKNPALVRTALHIVGSLKERPSLEFLDPYLRQKNAEIVKAALDIIKFRGIPITANRLQLLLDTGDVTIVDETLSCIEQLNSNNILSQDMVRGLDTRKAVEAILSSLPSEKELKSAYRDAYESALNKLMKMRKLNFALRTEMSSIFERSRSGAVSHELLNTWLISWLIEDYCKEENLAVPKNLENIATPLFHLLCRVEGEVRKLPQKEQVRFAYNAANILLARLDQRSVQETIVFGKERETVVLLNEEERYKASEYENVAKRFSGTVSKTFKGSKDPKENAKIKNGYIDKIKELSAAKRPATVVHYLHGGPMHSWIVGGQPGAEKSPNLRDPNGVSYLEIAEALVDGQANESIIDLSHMLFVLDGCYQYNLAVTMLRSEIEKAAAAKGKQVKALPQIITAANLDRYSWFSLRGQNQLTGALLSDEIKFEQGKPLYLKDFISKVEPLLWKRNGPREIFSLGSDHQDPAVFIFLTSEEVDAIIKGLGLPSTTKFEPFLEISSTDTYLAYNMLPSLIHSQAGALEADLIGKLFDSTGAILTNFSATFDAKESILTVTRQDGQDIFDMNGVNKGKAIKLKVIKGEYPNPRLDGFNAKARSLRRGLDRDASLGILEQVRASTSRVLAQNEFDILGIPDEDGVLYLPRSLIGLPIARFHEAGEYYLARNPHLVPEGVNNHNYLRGCGKDVREAYDKLTQQERKDLINIIASLQKNMARPITEYEKSLIRYNIAQGRTDRDVLYGLQDIIFGVAANENLSSIIQQMGERHETFREIEDRASVAIMEHSRDILRRVRTMPRASRQLEPKVLRLFELAKKTRDGVGSDAKEGVDLLKALLVGSRPAWLDFGRNHIMDIEQFVFDGSNADALRFLGLDYIPSAPFPNSGVLLYNVEGVRAVINTPEVQEYLKEIFGDEFPAISALTDVKEMINAILKKDPNLIGIILGIPVADVRTYINLRPASGYMADVPSYATRTQSPTEVEQSLPLQNIATGLAVTVTAMSGKKYTFFKTGSDIPVRAELLREGGRTYIVLIGNRYIDGSPEFGVELVRRGPISDEEAKDFVVESIYDQAEEGLKAYLVVNQGVKMFDNIYRMLKAVSRQSPAFVGRGQASPTPSPRAFMLPEDVGMVLGDALQHYTHQRFEYFNRVTSDPARGISCLPAQRDAPATQIYQYDEKEVPEGELPISAFVVSPGGFVLINSRLLNRALGEARFAIATFTLALCTGVCIRATKNGEVYYGIGHVVIGRVREKPTRNLARDLRFICQQLEGFDNIELVADYIPDSYESFDETQTQETIRREYPGVRRVELRSRKKMLDLENMMVAQDGAVVATENNEYFPYPWEAQAGLGADAGVAEGTGLVSAGIGAYMAEQADMARLGLSGLAKDGIEKLLGAVDSRIRLVLNGHAGLNTSQIDDMRDMLERARGLLADVVNEEDRAWLEARIRGYESGLSRLPTQVEVALPDTNAVFAALEGSRRQAEEALQSGDAQQAQGTIGEFYARLDAAAAASVPGANFRGFLGWLSAKVPATDRARPLIDTMQNHKDLLREGDALLLLPQDLTNVDGDLREILRQLTDSTTYDYMVCIRNNILAMQGCEELMARVQAASSNRYNEQRETLNAYAALYIRTAALANIVMALDFLTVANVTSDNAATVFDNLGYSSEERKKNYPRRTTPLARAVLAAYRPYLVAQARLLRGAVANIMADFGAKKEELDKLPKGYKYDKVQEEDVRKNLMDLERVGSIIDRLIAAMDDKTIEKEKLDAILNRDFLALFNILNNANYICVVNPILEVAKVAELPKGPPAEQISVVGIPDGIVVEEWGRQFLAGEVSAEELADRIVLTPVREVQANIVRRVLESAPVKLDEFNRTFAELAGRTPQAEPSTLSEGRDKELDAMARREQEIADRMTRGPAPAKTLDDILADNPELQTDGMSKVRDMLRTDQPRETQDMMRAINYTVDIYRASREVIRETSVPDNPRTVFVPVSERFCPTSSIVLKGKEQATWKELRDRLSKEYNFSNLRVVFYDGTLQDLEEKMGKAEGLNAKNTVIYMDEMAANETPDKVKALNAHATVVKEALTPKAELKPGEEEGAYISIGGHVALALGILDVVSESRTDREYLVLVTNLMTAISRKAVTPEAFQDMLRKGDLRIQLPPITKIDIDKNMNTFFIAEEAAMKSL